MNNLAFMPSSEDSLQDVNESVADWQYPLDLNRLLIPCPASTFILRADTNRSGVKQGDIVIVNRSVPVSRGKLVVSVEEGELRLAKFPVREVWGVVTGVIRSFN